MGQIMVTIRLSGKFELPATYITDLWREKCDQTYQHVYECYYGSGQVCME